MPCRCDLAVSVLSFNSNLFSGDLPSSIGVLSNFVYGLERGVRGERCRRGATKRYRWFPPWRGDGAAGCLPVCRCRRFAAASNALTGSIPTVLALLSKLT